MTTEKGRITHVDRPLSKRQEDDGRVSVFGAFRGENADGISVSVGIDSGDLMLSVGPTDGMTAMQRLADPASITIIGYTVDELIAESERVAAQDA